MNKLIFMTYKVTNLGTKTTLHGFHGIAALVVLAASVFVCVVTVLVSGVVVDMVVGVVVRVVAGVVDGGGVVVGTVD